MGYRSTAIPGTIKAWGSQGAQGAGCELLEQPAPKVQPGSCAFWQHRGSSVEALVLCEMHQQLWLSQRCSGCGHAGPFEVDIENAHHYSRHHHPEEGIPEAGTVIRVPVHKLGLQRHGMQTCSHQCKVITIITALFAMNKDRSFSSPARQRLILNININTFMTWQS